MTQRKNGYTYADSGVDINAGEALVEKIKPMARSTRRKGAEADLGGFGGLFDLKAAGFRDPILVSGTDGVGTKLKVAIDSGIHDTVGIDLVAMCVNDIVVQGAEPLFFLDYFATGKLEVDQAAAVIAGIAEGCRQSGCALIGGETAEMPGLYGKGDYDLAGFAVGAVERDAVLPRMDAMREGDVLIGVASSGIHSNGFSLVRRLVTDAGLRFDAPCPFDRAQTLGRALLTPTRLYVKSMLAAIRAYPVKGLSHVTGGGITGNLPRVLPDGLDAHVDLGAWTLPPVFGWLMQQGGIETAEMLRTFNCGIGMIVVVDAMHVLDVMALLEREGEQTSVIGTLQAGGGEAKVVYAGAMKTA